MDFFNVFYNTINGCLEVYLICFFCKIFLQPKKFKSRNIVLFMLMALFVAFLCVSKIKQLHLPVLIILTLFIALLYKSHWYIHVFLTATVTILFSLSEVVVAVLCEYILKVDVATLKTGNYLFAGMLISKLVIFAICVGIRAGKHKLPYYQVKGLWVYIAFMLFVSWIVVFMILDYMYTITNNPAKQMMSLITITLLILTNILLFYIIDRIYEYSNAQHQLMLANQLIENQKESYKKLYDNQNDIRQIRHDLKNVLIGVLHEIEKGDTVSGGNHIRGYLNDIDNDSYNFKSGNSVIDTLIYAKKDVAEAHGIEFNIDLQLSTPIYIDTIDFAVLFGNAIDNAIEATINSGKPKKVVDISVISKNSSLVLVFKNPVNERIDVQNLSTIKPDKKRHGFGLLQIKSLAEQYNGTVFLECSEEEFKTTIMLNHNKKTV